MYFFVFYSIFFTFADFGIHGPYHVTNICLCLLLQKLSIINTNVLKYHFDYLFIFYFPAATRDTTNCGAVNRRAPSARLALRKATFNSQMCTLQISNPCQMTRMWHHRKNPAVRMIQDDDLGRRTRGAAKTCLDPVPRILVCLYQP